MASQARHGHAPSIHTSILRLELDYLMRDLGLDDLRA